MPKNKKANAGSMMSLKDALEPKKSKKTDSNDSSFEIDATKVVKDFKAGFNYKEGSYHSIWEDAYKIYNNTRVKYGYSGVSDSFIPETFTIVESLVANIAGGKPQFKFVSTYEEQEQDTEVLNQLMDYYWECNKMGLKTQQWVREMLLYGTSVLYVSWDAKKEIPCIYNIPIRDFFVNPEATCYDDARYMGFRYLGNIEELKKQKVYDADEDKLVSKYKNLGDVYGNSTGRGDQMDKELKDSLQGSTLGRSAEKEQAEIILIYYKDPARVVEVANRTVVIRNVENPLQREEKTIQVEAVVDGQITEKDRKVPAIEPFFPFAILRDYIDTSLFYGRGEVQIIMDRQEQLNDVENQDMDNLSYINNVMFQIDPQFAHLVPEIESIPGAIYPVPRGALNPIERPQIDADLDSKKMQIKDEMRRATAADEVIQGASQDQGRVTATEVNAQLNQATQRFSTKVNNIEVEGYAQLASHLYKMSQIFVTQKMAIRILGPDGVEFKDYDPDEYVGDYEPHVKLESTLKAKEVERGMKDNQLLQLIVGNEAVNQKEALRFAMKKLGANEDDIERMLTLPPPPPMPMMPPMGGAPTGSVPVPAQPPLGMGTMAPQMAM